MKILVEISARHVHLSQEHLETLFGSGYELNKVKNLSQKGQFAVRETVIIQTEKDKIENVRILGPVRPRTQAEVSKTEARQLGVDPPVRKSGNLDGSAGCKLIGPQGEVDLKEGMIIAWRHIHLDPETAKKYSLDNLGDDKYISVKIETSERSLTFHQVRVRIDPSFTPAFHIDTDEANAAGIEQEIEGEIITD